LITSPLAWVLALIVVSRLAELTIAEVNTRRLRADGWREVGARHYPLFVVLHGSLLVAIAVATPLHRQPIWGLVGILAGLQAVRFWTIASLGGLWTTRIITRDGARLGASGPYRWMRHPAYAVAAIEVAVLPLAFGDWVIALAWSTANALLLRHRIAVENAALAPRQAAG
jgi:methyltransferase